MRLLEQADSILELVRQAGERDEEKMLQVVQKEKGPGTSPGRWSTSTTCCRWGRHEALG